MEKDKLLKQMEEMGFYEGYYSSLMKLLPTSKPGQVTSLCPFHNDTAPSLSINVTNGLFNCFSCGAHGSIFDFRMKYDGMSFAQCLDAFQGELASIGLFTKKRVVQASPVQSVNRKNNLTVIPSFTGLQKANEALFHEKHRAMKEFLNVKRGINDESLRKFLIGFKYDTKEIVLPFFIDSDEAVSAVKLIRYDLKTGEKRIRTWGSAQLFGVREMYAAYEKFGAVNIVEGELDMIVANQNGLLAVSGTAGAGTWKSEWNNFFTGRNVNILYDSDTAGRTGAKKVAEALSSVAASVRCVDIFGDQANKELKDVTDFFVKRGGSKDELSAIIERSEKLPLVSGKVEPELENRPVAPPNVGSEVIKQPSAPPKIAPEVEKELKKTQSMSVVNPAQDFGDGILSYGVLINGKSFLVNSQHQCFPISQASKYGIEVKHSEVGECHFTTKAIDCFLHGTAEVHPFALFEEIRDYVKRFIVLQDPRGYSFLALWVMGTYLFRAFRYYPYVHLSGEKRSGKTLLMEILMPISFNGQLSVNSTEAVLFRDIENNAPTWFLDEIEKFRKEDRDRYGAVMDILKSGFTKSGSVKRCVGPNKDRVGTFSTYSPKMLAGINDLEDVLSDRAIQIKMLRKTEAENVERYTETRELRSFHRKMRNKLYVYGLTYAPALSEIYTEESENIEGLGHLNNRELDIWSPIILQANLVDKSRKSGQPSVTDEMVLLSISSARQREIDDQENDTVRIIRVLEPMIETMQPVREEDGKKYFDKDMVFDVFQRSEDFSYLQSKKGLTRLLKKVDVPVKICLINGRTKSVYIIDPEKVKEFSTRYGATGT